MHQTDLSKHIVLYADDDPDDLMLVTEAFNRYANNVKMVTASDGKEALSFLENLSEKDPSPCLIILDINMPRLNGKEALKKIRQIKRFQNIPVVLFTTSSFHADKEFASQHNASFITKPLDVRHLEMIADQFIDHCSDDIKKNISRNIGQNI